MLLNICSWIWLVFSRFHLLIVTETRLAEQRSRDKYGAERDVTAERGCRHGPGDRARRRVFLLAVVVQEDVRQSVEGRTKMSGSDSFSQAIFVQLSLVAAIYGRMHSIDFVFLSNMLGENKERNSSWFSVEQGRRRSRRSQLRKMITCYGSTTRNVQERFGTEILGVGCYFEGDCGAGDSTRKIGFLRKWKETGTATQWETDAKVQWGKADTGKEFGEARKNLCYLLRCDGDVYQQTLFEYVFQGGIRACLLQQRPASERARHSMWS